MPSTKQTVQRLLEQVYSPHARVGLAPQILATCGKDLTNLDLQYIDFSNRDLRGHDFSDSDASHANFTGSVLRGADFRRTILASATLDETQCGEIDEDKHYGAADFSWAVMPYVKMRHSTLNGVSFAHAYFEETDFAFSDVDGVRWDREKGALGSTLGRTEATKTQSRAHLSLSGGKRVRELTLA